MYSRWCVYVYVLYSRKFLQEKNVIKENGLYVSVFV